MKRTLPPLAIGLALSPLLALASCNKQSAVQAGSAASGEVMPATVTDAMLNTDRSQAEAPIAPAARSPGDVADAAPAASASDPAPETSAADADAVQPAEGAAAPVAPPKPKPAASLKPPTPKPPTA